MKTKKSTHRPPSFAPVRRVLSDGLIPASEQLLDAKGVGKRMILSPRTVLAMALDRRLPFYQIGNFKRFKWAEIEKYLETHNRCEAQGAFSKN